MARHGLTGVLLVGGASTRFGSPKALARLGEETLAERAWRVLGEACEERIATGKAADALPLPFPVLDDGSEIRAPLAGVVAGLRAAGHDLCVFLPVDSPLVSPESLLRLAEAASPAAAPPTGPLPGAYRRSLLPLLEDKLARGDYALRDLGATVVELDPRELVNVNTPAELATLHSGRPMATMADLDELALSLPEVTKELSDDGRPSYLAHGRRFILHRSRRPDAVDPETGERMDDVLMFRVESLDVKDLILADDRGVYFTTPHFDGYAAVLVRIRDLKRIDREELRDLVVDSWMTRAHKRVAKAWLAENAQ